MINPTLQKYLRTEKAKGLHKYRKQDFPNMENILQNQHFQKQKAVRKPNVKKF